MGGTKLIGGGNNTQPPSSGDNTQPPSSGDNTQIITLLKELISAVKQGGDVYIDGAKAGRSLALATSKMG